MESHPRKDRQLLAVMIALGCLAGAIVVIDAGCDITSIPGLNSPTSSGGVRGSDRTPTPSSSPTPSPSPDGEECAVDSDCDDGLFCSGEETCVNDLCVDGTSPCDAQTETCDEGNDVCDANVTGIPCASDVNCPDDLACDTANNVCVPLEGCGRGACNIGNSSPGCNNQQCCDDVCLFDLSCCNIQWTQECANLALSLSTCLQP
ncbi:MAG: hypothetical protein DHS20C16_20690 [Phycisphaerae bacterium]|nr:MAG: hypothetical protein DHS20C16_20690 [Phycisphaerae bacterium]